MIKHAEQVISFYPVKEPVIEFIRHNENMTFKVTDAAGGKAYLLRIHHPRTAGLSGTQHTLEGLKSEVYLLQELNRRKAIQVQEPVVNHAGEYVTLYPSEEFGSCYATVLEWLEGAVLTGDEENIGRIAYTLGETFAELHNASGGQQLSGLTRPVYGVQSIDSAIEELKCGITGGVYTQELYDIIVEVLDVIKVQLTELDARQDSWGIIHADVQPGNVIVQGATPHLIDFCLSGYGYYLFDVGSASTALKSELRPAFLEGYSSRRDFTIDDIRYIEGQILMDVFISYAMFIRDPASNGWVKEHAVKVYGKCKDFLAGKEVYHLL
ncbi:phosphotransferase enzyme family protein [Paenibacillus sp. FSL R7-0331]|uniref:phosphotransferase enzyme family protein n=1 Tax=Paenibacillus sp. FSL R7-0331 TaxID=1536773 RepID=UPI0004F8427C|nr:phosphotransferase [Paenibacillus sp. FSL R7-0331]AIQ54750.1 hypothetical protein R70331_26770 [Paenibacillus sp. FSL R7-0331]